MVICPVEAEAPDTAPVGGPDYSTGANRAELAREGGRLYHAALPSGQCAEEKMEKVQVYLRFNTRNDNDNPLPWRVMLSQGMKEGILQYTQEYAAEVRFETPVQTSQDEIEPGVVKWHIKSLGYIHWQGDVCLVTDQPQA
jgi:hypothetical protein